MSTNKNLISLTLLEKYDSALKSNIMTNINDIREELHLYNAANVIILQHVSENINGINNTIEGISNIDDVINVVSAFNITLNPLIVNGLVEFEERSLLLNKLANIKTAVQVSANITTDFKNNIYNYCDTITTLLNTLTVQNKVYEKNSDIYDKCLKINDYLYEIYYTEVDYSNAEKYFRKNYLTNYEADGCSTIVKGNLFGRNYDAFYNNDVEFILHVSRGYGTYASTSIVAGIPGFNKQFIESGEYSDKFNVLPFYTKDGINEYGVACSIHSLSTDKGVTTGTNPSATISLCTLQLPRFVLDNYKSALDAANAIKTAINVYSPKIDETARQEYSLVIADKTSAYLIEFINNTCKVTELNSFKWVTNFYLDGVYIDDEKHPQVEDISDFGKGIERFNLIADNYNSINDIDSMISVLEKVYYSKQYNYENDPRWNSEFTGVWDEPIGTLTVMDTRLNPEKFITVFQNQYNNYMDRDRDTGLTKHTLHSVVYNTETCKLFLITQEGDYDSCLVFDTDSLTGSAKTIYNYNNPLDQVTAEDIKNIIQQTPIERAVSDKNGANIDTTYLKITDLTADKIVDTLGNQPVNIALKLGTIKVGNANKPIYLDNGIPTACSVTIPNDAKFTDTTYQPTTDTKDGLFTISNKQKLDGIEANANKYVHPTESGYKHIPSGGSEGKILKYSSDGTAVWADENTGLMTPADKVKLNGIEANANKYTHPESGVTAGTYSFITLDKYGHITNVTNPTTLAGYGITDAKIDGGTIYLGSKTITPLIASSIDGKQDKLPTTSTAGKVLKSTSTSGKVEWGDVDGLPSQSGNSGKFLTTNGTTPSWATVTVKTYTAGEGISISTDGVISLNVSLIDNEGF